MSVMRVSAGLLWPEPFADTDVDRMAASYARAFSVEPTYDTELAPFEWDGDPWTINVIGHGLFGSELYLRPRICRKSPLPSLLFTAAASATWEYVFEANAVHPSGLDLWFSPMAGLLLGEARFRAWSAAKGIESSTWRTIVQSLVDPFGGGSGVPTKRDPARAPFAA
jgi:hypothetical protein